MRLKHEVFSLQTENRFTAGTGLTLVNQLTSGKLNYCTMNWIGDKCRLYVVEAIDDPFIPNGTVIITSNLALTNNVYFDNNTTKLYGCETVKLPVGNHKVTFLKGSFSQSPTELKINNVIVGSFFGNFQIGSASDIITIYCRYACFLAGTKIRLFNGTQKNVQDITYDDQLLAWDFDNGCFSSAKPAWIKKQQQIDYYFQNKFNNGIILKTTGQNGEGHKGHEMFIIEDQKFDYIPESVGKTTFSLNGNIKLLESKQIKKKVKFYNLITKNHYNLFANGILTSCGLNNLYKIQNMKFIKKQIINNIELYKEFNQELVKDLRLSQQIKDQRQYINNMIKSMKAKENLNL